MAADYIKIDRNNTAAPFANEIISAVAQLRQAQQTLEQIQAKGFRMFVSGSPNNFTQCRNPLWSADRKRPDRVRPHKRNGYGAQGGRPELKFAGVDCEGRINAAGSR